MTFLPTRRAVLAAPAAAMAAGWVGGSARAAAPDDPRLVVVNLRGAMDGLHLVQPYGDPGLAALRGPLALPEPGAAGGLLDLGGFFGLHPALPAVHALFRGGQAAIVHAIAGPYRTRSHFEAQDLLESGAAERLASGWLNRALRHVDGGGPARAGIAVGPDIPLVLRGPTPVGAYAPTGPEGPGADLLRRVAALGEADPAFGPAIREGLRARRFAAGALDGAPSDPRVTFGKLAASAGRLLATTDGPRVAALDLSGWDTHVNQLNRAAPLLAALDAGVAALRAALGPAWGRTAVLLMTEFGRTARVNGSNGTDHGTAGVAMLLGGAVRGGRVLADWPGLSERALHEGRDLAPTRDLRALIKPVLATQLRLSPAQLAAALPGSAGVSPIGGLLA